MKKVIIITALLWCALSAQAQDSSAQTQTLTPNSSDGLSTPPSPNGITPDDSTTTPSNAATTTSSPSNSTTTVSTPMTTTPTTTDPSTPSTTTMTPDTTTSSPTSSNTLPTTYTCVGSSPDWNLTIGKDLITYSTAKSSNIKLKSVTSVTPMGDGANNLQVFAAKNPQGKNVMILVNKNTTGCTNSTTGQSYQYQAFIVFPQQVVVGCCNAS